jgi:hypothetical protein
MLFGVDIIVYNSEWRVKVTGNHSCIGLGSSELGQEVRGRSSKLRLVSLLAENK